MNLEQLMAAMQATASAPPRKVEVKGWGTVYVREITVSEVEEQTQDTEGNSNDKHRLARAASRVICDEKGRRLFDPNNDDHVELIAKQPWSKLRQVIETSEGDPKKD